MSFRLDDYVVPMDHAGWSWNELFLPMNEHWSTLTLVVFKLLLLVFGLRDYLPYLLVLALMHAAAAFLLFAYIRGMAGDLLALGACLLFAFLAQGSEEFFWAIQINLTGSVLLGLGALLALDIPAISRRRLALASLLLLASLMFFGEGLIFLVMASLLVTLRRRVRSHAAALLLPALAYMGWFVAFGSHASNYHDSLLRHPELGGRFLLFFAYGLASAVTRTFELPLLAAIPVGAVVVLGLRHRWFARNHRWPAIAAATVAACVFYLLTGFERLYTSPDPPRYVYAVAVFVLIGTAGAVAPVTWRPSLLRALLLVGLGIVTTVNVALLATFAVGFRGETPYRRDQVQTALAFSTAPGVDRDTEFSPYVLPTVNIRRLVAATTRFGSPFPEVTPESVMARRSPAVLDAIAGLFLFEREPGAAAAGPGCVSLAPGRETVVPIPPSGGMAVVSGAGAGFLYRLGIAGKVASTTRTVELPPGESQVLRVPTLVAAAPSIVLIQPIGGDGVSVCPFG